MKLSRKLLTLLVVLSLWLAISAPALAEDFLTPVPVTATEWYYPFDSQDDSVNIQLNGEIIDAGATPPIVIEDKALVPFRSLLEAMGARVNYNETTKVVSAVKGDVTVKLIVDSNHVTVTQNGKTQYLVSEVTPVIQDEAVYIPARIAAEAFGYRVGWASWDRTVIIIDANELVKDLDSRFSVIDRVLIAAQKELEEVPEETIETKGQLDFKFTGTDYSGTKTVVPVTGDFNFIANSKALDGSMLFNLDLAGISDVAALLEEAKVSVDAEIIADLEANKYFLNSKWLNKYLEEDENLWYLLDAGNFLGQVVGMDYYDILSQATGIDFMSGQPITVSKLMESAVLNYELNYTSDYDDLKEGLELLEAIVGDKSLTRTGNTYQNKTTIPMDYDPNGLNMDLEFTLDKDDNITALKLYLDYSDDYETSFDFKLDAKGDRATLDMKYIPYEDEFFTMHMDADGDDVNMEMELEDGYTKLKMTMKGTENTLQLDLNLNSEDYFEAVLKITATMNVTNKNPRTVPPADAQVKDIFGYSSY